MADVAAGMPMPRRGSWTSRLWHALLLHPAATVASVAVVVVVPYLIAGVNFEADDWFFLNHAHFDGWLHAAGGRLDGRPIGSVATALTFGLIGAHPLPLVLVLTVLRTMAAVSLRRMLAHFLPAAWALTITLVWVLLPTHLMLEMWSSTIPSVLAFALGAEGIAQLATAAESSRTPLLRWALGTALLALAAASYELVLPVAAVAVAAIAVRRGRRNVPSAAVIATLALLCLSAVWTLTHETMYNVNLSGTLDLGLAARAQLAYGLALDSPSARLAAAAGLLTISAAAIAWRSDPARSERRRAAGCVLAGVAVAVLGLLPLARLGTNFQGIDDRLSLVSCVGAAMIAVGGAGLLASVGQRPGRARFAALVLLALVVIPLRVERVGSYVQAGKEAILVHRALADRARVEREIHLADVPAVVDHYVGSNTSAAVPLLLDDPTVIVDDGGITDPFQTR